ncbi:heavy-metal-associated domain-containing protein [Pirellulaceae bacterium SH449]
MLRAVVVRGGVMLFVDAFPNGVYGMLSLSRRTSFVTGVMLFAFSLLTAAPVQAADADKMNIVMTVGEMCGGCVKKITKRFDGVEGIARVTCSLEQQSVTLIPKDRVRLSPKGIWEIMESIGKTPTKMVTPDGTFISKPRA